MPKRLIDTDCVDKVSEGIDVATLHCIPVVFQNIIFWLFALVGIAAVILIAYSGIKFILSGGDAKQVEGARKTFTYAIVGLIVVLFAYAIMNLIAYVTGTSCFLDFLNFQECQRQGGSRGGTF